MFPIELLGERPPVVAQSNEVVKMIWSGSSVGVAHLKIGLQSNYLNLLTTEETTCLDGYHALEMIQIICPLICF